MTIRAFSSNQMTHLRTGFTLVLLFLLITLPGCKTLQELAALRQVAFTIDSVTNASLVGVDLASIQSYEDVNPLDALRVANAVRQKSLPFDFTLHLSGRNPEDNDVQARLVRMDWTLFLEDRETISGVFNDDVALPPGQSVDIPITIQLDLYTFFDANARDLIELALNISGKGGKPKNVRLTAVPTIDTPIGPIRYPGTLDIVSTEIGS